jgi:hypothetical protein
VSGWRNGKWAATLDKSRKGIWDEERKAGTLQEIGAKELKKYRKGFLIFRI